MILWLVRFSTHSPSGGQTMKPRYLCAYHAERIRASEQHACHSWLELMRRGTLAYAECRVEAAQIYLGAALDIALLRLACQGNKLFTALHLSKPLEFMIELLVVEGCFNQAMKLLSKISSALDQSPDNSMIDELVGCLAQHYQRVSNHEKTAAGHSKRRALREYEVKPREPRGNLHQHAALH